MAQGLTTLPDRRNKMHSAEEAGNEKLEPRLPAEDTSPVQKNMQNRPFVNYLIAVGVRPVRSKIVISPKLSYYYYIKKHNCPTMRSGMQFLSDQNLVATPS
jgi:hypothetical protein